MQILTRISEPIPPPAPRFWNFTIRSHTRRPLPANEAASRCPEHCGGALNTEMNHTSARLFFHLRKSAAVPRSSAVSAVATLKCGHQPRLWSWEAKSLLALPQTLGRHRPFVSSIIAAQMSNGGHAATMERTSRWRGLRVCCATEARLMSSKSPANDGEAMDPKTWVDSMPTKVFLVSKSRCAQDWRSRCPQ
jgi:hypothetical protein